MIDYIEATKHFCRKDTINLGFCRPSAIYDSGWEKYTLQGCEKIEIWYNEPMQMMRLKGSIMYFLNGHNFTFSQSEYVQGLNLIGNMINCKLFDAELDVLEYGTIITTPKPPQTYITNHKAGKGLTMDERPKDKGRCRFFSDSYVDLKMYDAGRNIIHKQGITMKEIIKKSGWNPDANYLKWEAHYRKPEKILNRGEGISIEMMLHPDFCSRMKSDLYNQYLRLIPMKSLITPTSKKDLTSSDIILLMLAENKANEGTSLQELKQLLYDKINAFPDEVLSKSDKDARKRNIKNMIDKIRESDVSEYDLSNMLATQLEINN